MNLLLCQYYSSSVETYRKEIEATEQFLQQDNETKALLERLARQKQDELLARKLQEEEEKHANKEQHPSSGASYKLRGGVSVDLNNRINDLHSDELLAKKLQQEENSKVGNSSSSSQGWCLTTAF